MDTHQLKHLKYITRFGYGSLSVFLLLLCLLFITGCYAIQKTDKSELPTDWQEAIAQSAGEVPDISGEYVARGERPNDKYSRLWLSTYFITPGHRRDHTKVTIRQLETGNLHVILSDPYQTVLECKAPYTVEDETGAILVDEPVELETNTPSPMYIKRKVRFWKGPEDALYVGEIAKSIGFQFILYFLDTEKWVRWPQATPERLKELSKQYLFPGDRMIPFDIIDLKGNRISNETLAGKVAFISYWSPKRPLKNYESMIEVYKEYQDRGFEIVMRWGWDPLIEERADVEEYIAKYRTEWINYYEPDQIRNPIQTFFEEHGVFSVLLDRDGLIAGVNIRHLALKEELEKIFE